MNDGYDVSIALLTYNAKIVDVYRTLQSILLQKKCYMQIVISDDGSMDNHFDEITRLLVRHNFSDYVFVKHKENVGTVQNLLDALDKCSAKYVKDIGQGDVLYDDNTLSDLLKYAEQNRIDMIYGEAVPFEFSKSRIIMHNNIAMPQDTRVYKKDSFSILKKYVLCADTACGAAMFFKRDVLIKYLNEIVRCVRYSEDLTIKLMLCDNLAVRFYDRKVVYYECCRGISNSNEWIQIAIREENAIKQMLIERIAWEVDKKHWANVISYWLDMVEHRTMGRKIRYLFSDVVVTIHCIKKKIFPRRINNIEKEFLYECMKRMN